MFRRIRPAQPNVTIYIDDRPHRVNADETIATILVNSGIPAVHNAPDGAPRGPYCMMGVCFECLVEIDGRPNQQACQAMIRDGMQIRRQQAPDLDSDFEG